MQAMIFNNKRPEREDYPRFEPADFEYDVRVIARTDAFIVDDDGYILVVTSGNNKIWPNDFLASINGGWIRAKYLGNTDDGMVCTNQIRLATIAEIAEAVKYVPDLQPDHTGNIVLF